MEDAFWHLLRAGLWGNKAELEGFRPLSDKEWHEIVKLAVRSSSMGIVEDGIMMLPVGLSPEKAFRSQKLIEAAKLIYRHQRHNLAIRHLIKLLDEMGVPAVLLKGQSLARNYRNPEARKVGDIDLYIGEEGVDELGRKLIEMGYAKMGEKNDSDKHLVLTFEECTVELHRVSMYMYTAKTDRLYQEWWRSNVFERAEKAYIDADGKWSREEAPDSQRVLLPDKTMNVFFTFCHVFGHYMIFQFQFKQLMDLARLLYVERDGIDRELLEAKLREQKLLKAWQIVGCYLHSALGLEKECIPCYSSSAEGKGERFARQIHRRIFEGRKDKLSQMQDDIGNRAYSYFLHWWFAAHTVWLFPSLTANGLWWKTVRGLQKWLRRR